MSWGMPFSEYWDGDPMLAKYYRKKHEIDQKEKNHELWLQGMYMYHAVSVVIGNAFRKKGSRPQDYPDAPYPITPLEIREDAERRAKQEYEAKKARMHRLAAAINAGFAKKNQK